MDLSQASAVAICWLTTDLAAGVDRSNSSFQIKLLSGSTMDLQLIAIAVVVIIVIIILLACFVFSTRERTFEDALAEQKGLGILLSSGQHGKSGEKHKDKHKSHHDTGGGAQKKKAQQQKSTETVAASGTTQQRPPKKEKEEKEVRYCAFRTYSKSLLMRSFSEASTSTVVGVSFGGRERGKWQSIPHEVID